MAFARGRVPAVALGLVAALASGTAALASGAAAFAATRSETVVAASGDVAATLTYTHAPNDDVAPFTDLRLTIAREGKTLYSAAVDNPACGKLCWPNLPGPLAVRDVEGDGQPDVLVNLYTGGAHCCNVTDLFRYDAAGHDFTSVLHIWGGPDYSLERLDAGGDYEFVTADDRFAYEFTAYAFSGLPVEILRLVDGRFVNVTRSYPKLAAADAAEQWKNYLENRAGGTGLGFLGAWAADEYNLGRGAAVAKMLGQLEHANELRSSDPGIWVGGSKFVTALDRFLQKTGYNG
jgi:hypothetical protein